MGFPNGWRRIAVAVTALLATAAVAATVYRVLAPAEVSTPARAEYPQASSPAPGVVGRLPVAPLIVDGRLRIYAAHRQVYADRPVEGRHRTTPYWSYRRWPAKLDGVVASGTTVVTRWSDGRLVALDGRTGRVAWQADGPVPVGERTVRRTGAATVWDPRGLFVARAPAGRQVVVAAGAQRVRAVDLADGRELWQSHTTVTVPPGDGSDAEAGCRNVVGATAFGQLVTVDSCAGPAVVEFRDAVTGTVGLRWRPPGVGNELVAIPVGCGTGRTGCTGLRTATSGDDTGRGWLLGAGEPVAAPALDRPDAVLVGGTAVAVVDGVPVGRSARTGADLWRRPGLPQVRLLAAQPDRVHLLTETNDLLTLDPTTGEQRSFFALNAGSDGTGWTPGAAYAADGFVAVERLRKPVDPTGDDQRYYLTSEPVILAAT
ncbi:PQQ-binding-like beta-propeller repeat protein [Micromonospora peucetia]|uniref:PQQ-binding-like beta-propeller repeat protein n=1 Tax=Micromonospora peucetia TaxID=47871 RepID=A0A1C6V3W8_9ACTN|nr:PQQ-binding-like beta-propeller repeat protein [Micromonospora peucetia]WSA35326.1 PQQ-binding-like beta-propeller repeat protein [Micromonospora peucetia]SCL60935.1 PQQ-like domain-containing protein [Micromonospora peucetia]